MDGACLARPAACPVSLREALHNDFPLQCIDRLVTLDSVLGIRLLHQGTIAITSSPTDQELPDPLWQLIRSITGQDGRNRA